ncbi:MULTISPECIES: RnfABCDGE type electron transport complex subunit G [Prevotellaceae]|jgi:electron transport complex protein RnfG|uniref:Ion-translocating oxidoreductase complex subunit G n=1 Tax=Xylanibacter rarus TaxID=1676614 RepID=A0A8E1UPU2_9BACT|nr:MULTISPECIES: RnfABCDGE type electron transport complex subunit G [Prevotellaceae]KOO67581.1 Na+-transporting NADH:ubiquinone oxidoreductase subunit G [Xylanibacter rarus]CCX68463.1 electron transport complex [Prevotella sp. CAG:255]HJH77055.1 RnfABCDGE type electron transport complex subunit G [Prevotellaceae bacterium]
MKKLESSITNMVLVLVGVALITGGILAYVNHITEAPIKLQAEKTLADGIKAVMGGVQLSVAENDTIKQTIKGKEAVFVIHKTVDSNKQDLGVAVESTTGGFGGDLKVLVGFDKDGNILGYTILQHAETPGLGAKADKWFQKDGKGSIIGKNPNKDNLTVKKDGGDIDAITASTITSRAFLLAVTQAYNAYKSGHVDANTSATGHYEK